MRLSDCNTWPDNTIIELRTAAQQRAFFAQLQVERPSTSIPSRPLRDSDGYHIGICLTPNLWSWARISYFRDSSTHYSIIPFTTHIYRRSYASA